MSRLVLALALVVVLAVSGVTSRRVLTKRSSALESSSAADFSSTVFDSSFVEMRSGVAVWQCCRVCPQNHLLEIDQMFGSTPPPVRRYDEPQPAPSTFLEEAARIATSNSNCCNVCPTGLSGSRPEEPKETIPEGRAGVRKTGIRAPFKNLQFSLSRVPMPPCCPYCREQHMDEAFNLVVPPIRMRGLPYQQKKDLYSGKKVFLEVDAEVGVEADMEAEVEAEVASELTFMRKYTYTAPTEENCCNRCLRAPTEIETKTAAGEDMWPVNEERTEDPNAAEPADPIQIATPEAAAEEEPAAEAAAEEAPAAE